MLCSRVQNLLSAFCDSELSGEEMLRIRRHLHDCPGCRAEHQGVMEVKRLMGALGSPAPRREFHPAMLTQPVPGAWRRWMLRLPFAPAALELAAGYEMVARALATPACRSFSRVAFCSAAGLAAFAVGVLSRPQPPDAVTAHVPEMVTTEERMPAGRTEVLATAEYFPPPAAFAPAMRERTEDTPVSFGSLLASAGPRFSRGLPVPAPFVHAGVPEPASAPVDSFQPRGMPGDSFTTVSATVLQR
jgi:hypothetical protein